MIVTVTLNPAIDKRLHVPQLKLGAVQRTSMEESTAGGKGLNVSRVVHQLEEKVLATGMLGGMNGEWIRQRLNTEEIPHDFVTISGETRICLNLIDDSNGSSTEILERGPCITEKEAEEMLDKIRQLSAPNVWMLMSGSLPSGLPIHFYGLLIREAKKKGARVLLDTSGAALAEGVKAAPFVIKPNEEEILQLTGESVFHESSFHTMIPRLRDQGIYNIIVSLGAEGCMAFLGGKLYKVKVPRIQAVNAVGSGDSFMAGLAVALERGWDEPEALRLAAAAGATNAFMQGTGQIDQQILERLKAEVIVEPLLV